MQTDLYQTALRETNLGHMRLVEPGSDVEAQAIQSFKDQFAAFTPDHMRDSISRLYHEDAYFNDTLVELRGGKAIEDYFLKSAEAVEECRFDIHDVAHSDGNYYVRWTMTLRLKRFKDRPANVSTGVSHLRFDPDGRIVFHYDFWDSAHVYREIPILGGMIRWVQRRIASH